jgi:hypothetical protein
VQAQIVLNLFISIKRGAFVMKTLTAAALSLFVLIPSVSYADLKSTYCGGKEYLGNPGNKYPHLHCGKDFITYSKKSDNHAEIMRGSQPSCERLRSTLDVEQGDGELRTALKKVGQDFCKKKDEKKKN